MAGRLKIGALAVIGGLIMLLVYAWIDGGREDRRMIVQPVDLPMSLTESGA